MLPGSVNVGIVRRMRKRLDMLGRQARRRVVGFFSKHGFREEYFLTLMAILIGVATGCGASGFFLLIE